MLEKDDVRRGYDRLTDVYAEKRPDDGHDRALLEQFLTNHSPESVLDLGCGQGTPALAHADERATAVGLDLSLEQLHLARQNVPGAPLVHGDMTALPFADETFDAVIVYWSLIHVPLGDHQTVIDECERVLRTGGRLLLVEGTHEWCGENPDWLESGVRMVWNIAGAETTREQLEAAGFVLEDRWRVGETLGEEDEDGRDNGAKRVDEGEKADEANGDEAELPWTVFAARLEPS